MLRCYANSEAMNIFTHAKAWQIFAVMMLPMLVAPLLASSGASQQWLLVITLFWAVVLIGWYYSIGAKSNEKLPINLKKDSKLYQLGYAVVLFYMAITAFGFGFPVQNPENLKPDMPFWVIPLHIAATAGMFYGLWFTAKQFTALFKQSEVQFIDYSGPFFLLWFAPIGVWFIQPKVNELFGKSE